MALVKKNFNRRIYLDHASTTPVLPEVVRAMSRFWKNTFQNPSALYSEGVSAKKNLERARADVANVLHARPDEIIFTASGTESDNMAIFGIVRASKIKNPHIIVSAIEHPAILEVADEIKKQGGRVTIIPVDKNGLVEPQNVVDAITKNTILVSIMYANNEIGTVEPVREIAKVIRHARKKFKHNFPYFHTDASQAGNYLSLNVLELGVDMMTLDGSKIYGPKGIGMLFLKRRINLSPIIFGGGQESGKRSGTENLALIVGFANALVVVQKDREKESKRLCLLRDYFIKNILKKVKNASLNGHQSLRLPNNVNFCVPGISGEFAVIKLDYKGILCSSSSSCRTLSENNSSYVIQALGKKKCDESSLRFTLGRSTTKKDIDTALRAVEEIIESCYTDAN